MDLFKIREELNLGIPITNIKLKVTYYSRVSTDHLEQLSSLNNQKEYFYDFINNNPNWEYVESYVDEGISGTTDYKRDNFMRMIEDAKNNKFDLIVTKEISRFSRNTLDSIKYTRELLNYGVAVLFINDNINTALPDAELRLTIMSSLAQDEIRRLSERVKFGMNQSIKKGTILGNNNLYGYKKENNKLIIVKEEAEIIKNIFNMYVIDDYSLNKISKILNKKELNKNFSSTTIKRIINNPKYKGYYCGKKSEVINYITKKKKYINEEEWITYKDNSRIPKIVNEDIWNKANNKLKNRSLRFGSDFKENKIIYNNRYPLSAKIYCINDNKLFHRRVQCKNDISWICSNKLINGKKSCNSISLREKEIYFIFNDILENLNIKKELLENKLSKFYKKNITLDNNAFLEYLISILLEKIIAKFENNNIYLIFYLKINNKFNYENNFNFFRKNKINYFVSVSK